jgi:hypothetical protein
MSDKEKEIPIKTYKINVDKIESIEDVKSVFKLMDLTMTLGEGITPPKAWWEAIEKELLIEVKPIEDGQSTN